MKMIPRFLAAILLFVVVVVLTTSISAGTKNLGTVKFFSEEKGFGFIKFDESSKDIFVNKAGCIDPIKANDHVEFDVEDGPKGPMAVNVKLI